MPPHWTVKSFTMLVRETYSFGMQYINPIWSSEYSINSKSLWLWNNYVCLQGIKEVPFIKCLKYSRNLFNLLIDVEKAFFLINYFSLQLITRTSCLEVSPR